MKTQYFFLFLVITFAWSCSSTIKVSNQNIAAIYKSTASALQPQYTVYHSSDTATIIFFKLSANDLLHIKKDNSTSSAKLSISYQLTESFDSKSIIDSGSLVISDINSNNSNNLIVGNFVIKTSYGKSYLAEINLRDLNKAQTGQKSYLNIDRLEKNNRQDFLLLNEKNNVLFRNYVNAEEVIKIRHTNKTVRQLWVSYFSRSFPLPAPPFSTREFEPFAYRPDSVFLLSTSDSLFQVNFSKKGFYHIQADTTNNKTGLTIYSFEPDFPFVKTPEQLLEPLRYLTSKAEFLSMSNYTHKKTAVDSFWISCGGNTTKGKALIKRFYGRMQDANIYFSSYLEGWKSDRGLVYLIYGPPQFLYKTGNLEVWNYDFGGSRGRNGLTYNFSFTFVKVINPFTDNDYRLERNGSYKDNWYMAVDAWRLGQTLSEY